MSDARTALEAWKQVTGLKDMSWNNTEGIGRNYKTLPVAKLSKHPDDCFWLQTTQWSRSNDSISTYKLEERLPFHNFILHELTDNYGISHN